MAKERWSPVKCVIVTVLLVFVIGLVVGGLTGMNAPDPEAAGERFGRGLGPAMLAAGLIAYFVQKSRISSDKR